VKLDPQIDALYQLPLEQFTEKRNSLAKELTGTSRKQVKFLGKPPLPIWAVNQLYWHDRPTYNALVDASEKLRTAHRSALNGHKTDLRKPEQLHRAALERAVAKTMGLLEQSHGHVSDAARETIRKALGALPNDEAPGRLTRAPEAAGFSLLTGIKPRETPPEPAPEKRISRKADAATKAADVASAARQKAERARAEAREAKARALAERARATQTADAERELRRARKAAEQARFKVRKLSGELQRAQAAEERLAGQVSAVEQKLAGLRSD
jgi:hypothetical protein